MHRFGTTQFSLLKTEPATPTEWLNLDLVTAKNYLTHGLHPYPAKFIPQIPGHLMDRLRLKNAVVVDPFCGSGTVAVEASIRHLESYSSDLNPIATLITRAKTVTISPDGEKELYQILGSLHSARTDVDVPRFKNIDHWFSQEMANELSFLRHHILNRCAAPDARTLALAVFSSIIVRCSNQDSETRWVAVRKDLKRGYAIDLFTKRLKLAWRNAKSYASVAAGKTHVTDCDARNLSFLRDSVADLVVTSPPYLNSYDYYLYHKLRMFWLGFDHTSVQASEIGSRNKHSDHGLPVSSYELAMEQCLAEMSRVVKPGGHVAIVVGDGVWRGEVVRMDRIFTQLGVSAALTLMDSFSYPQRKYTSSFSRNYRSEQKLTHILLFTK